MEVSIIRNKLNLFKQTHFRYICTLLLLIIVNPTFAQSLDSKIAKIKQRYGVTVHYKYSPSSFFPNSWLKKPVNATGQAISKREASRVVTQIDHFLKNIPKRVIRLNITDIYLLKEQKFYGKSYGFSNSSSGIYIQSKGIRDGYSDDYLLRSLYHAFSSIVMRHYAFPEKQWNEVDKNHTYLKADSAVRFHDDIREINSGAAAKGFISKYASISMKKDFNTISEYLFMKPAELKSLAGKHRKIRKKLNLTIGFYKKVFGDNYRFY
ncbi:MAG: hypothetical protein GY951_10930 [Psychromonas sp.]|nr:hypothetical protein [Alteromonadales bacterium]MCP5078551.1 hypothetical protein [Psychromonas sp.]